LAFAVALDAGVDGGAGNAFFLGDAGDGLGSENLAPGLALYRSQVDEQPFLLPEIRRGACRRCWFGNVRGKENRGPAVASSGAYLLHAAVQVPAGFESEAFQIIQWHKGCT
jgi:hypothetical protein